MQRQNSVLFSIVTLGGLLLPAAAWANVGINGGPCTSATIGAAAAAASSGDRLYASPGVYSEGTVSLSSKDLTIFSSDAACSGVTSRQVTFEPTPGARGFFLEDSLLILVGLEVQLANTALTGATRSCSRTRR